MWSEEGFAWWTKGRKGKNSLSKGNDGSQKGGFRPYTQNKGKGKYQKGKGKEEAHPRSGRSASEATEEEGLAMAGNLLGLQLLDGFARKLTLVGWRYPL